MKRIPQNQNIIHIHYIYILPPGVNIPIYVEPFLVNDAVPTEEDINWAVKRLQNHCYGGLLGCSPNI